MNNLSSLSNFDVQEIGANKMVNEYDGAIPVVFIIGFAFVAGVVGGLVGSADLSRVKNIDHWMI